MNLEQFKIDLAVGVRRTLERIGKTELIGRVPLFSSTSTEGALSTDTGRMKNCSATACGKM